LTALAVPPGDVPPDEEQAAALLRTVLAGRRILLVLDNVVDTEGIRRFLPTTPGAAVIMAGRPAPTTVDGSGLLHLRTLPPPAAVNLVRRYVGADRVDADPDAAARLAVLCDCLPLALRIAATRLAQRPEWTVRDFATRLADPGRRLDALTCDGLSVRDSLREGVRILRRTGDLSATRALRLLGVLDVPTVDTAALAAALELPEGLAELAAERLVDAGLIETLSIDRYRVPDLVRLFARGEYATTAGDRAAVSSRHHR
jgi:hypothetical protein